MMSSPTASAAWSSSSSRSRTRAPDILDLDRYMRGAPAPAHAPALARDESSRLVVDAGGAGGARGKRHSHDSGLSDGTGSYVLPHRGRRRAPHARASRVAPALPAPPAHSAHSLRAFRQHCERALREQQEQIARVAQICERLSERRPPSPRSGASRRRTPHTPPTASSDLSSSSRSDARPMKQECKTYKIILTKLDELNRVFAARARSPPCPRPSPPPPPAPHAPHAPHPPRSAASVRDKLVGGESPRAGQVERAVGGMDYVQVAHVQATSPRPAARPAPRPAPRRAGRLNVATDSAPRDSSSAPGSDARGVFDLDDPVHLYAQAKRLQAMHATTGRDCKRDRDRDRSLRGAHTTHQSGAGVSLCALCRGYWRALRRCLAQQLSARLDAA